MGSKAIDVMFTSAEGCTVTIEGVVSYSIAQAQITGFRGTVTVGDSDGRPTKTMTFGKPRGNSKKTLPAVRDDEETDNEDAAPVSDCDNDMGA